MSFCEDVAETFLNSEWFLLVMGSFSIFRIDCNDKRPLVRSLSFKLPSVPFRNQQIKEREALQAEMGLEKLLAMEICVKAHLERLDVLKIIEVTDPSIC